LSSGTLSGTLAGMVAAITPARTNTVRIRYARISSSSQDHQLQLDALAAADCREVIVDTASSRGERPKLRATLAMLKPGDTPVVYKPGIADKMLFLVPWRFGHRHR